MTSPTPAGDAPEARAPGRETPTEEELVAILAAAEALWPKPAVLDGAPAPAETPRWRFSGRWWSKPVAVRRGRPGQG